MHHHFQLVTCCSPINSTASHTTMFSITPADAYICTAFVHQGDIPSSPSRPPLGFSVQALELFRIAHLRCPQFSQQAFIKTLSDLHSVEYQKYLSRQFSIAFDLYLSILGVVDGRVKMALGRNTGDWRLWHACPCCMYKLKEEPALVFDILWAQDGNDSLRRIIRRSPAADGDPSTPGLCCERTDTRKVLD